MLDKVPRITVKAIFQFMIFDPSFKFQRSSKELLTCIKLMCLLKDPACILGKSGDIKFPVFALVRKIKLGFSRTSFDVDGISVHLIAILVSEY